MPIALSEILEDRAQRDGRRHIQERHVDHLDVAYFVTYLAEAGANASAALTPRATQILDRLSDGELDFYEAAIATDTLVGTVTLSYSTLADLRARLRSRFRNSTGIEAANIAEFLLTLTDNQLQNLFNLANQTQVNQLKNRLAAKVAKRDAILAEAGE